jgi:hypothetical protein
MHKHRSEQGIDNLLGKITSLIYICNKRVSIVIKSTKLVCSMNGMPLPIEMCQTHRVDIDLKGSKNGPLPTKFPTLDSMEDETKQYVNEMKGGTNNILVYTSRLTVSYNDARSQSESGHSTPRNPL